MAPTLLEHDTTADRDIQTLTAAFKAEHGTKFAPTVLDDLRWKEVKPDGKLPYIAPATSESQMVEGKNGTYLSRKEVTNLQTGGITIMWGNYGPHRTCSGEYAPQFTFEQRPATERDRPFPEWEYDYTDPNGTWAMFLNELRCKTVANSSFAGKQFPQLMKEVGGKKSELEKLFLSALDRKSDNSCNRKQVKRFETPVLSINFTDGKNGTPPHAMGLGTASYLEQMTEYYQNHPNGKISADGITAIESKLKPALEASYAKQYPKMIQPIEILDSNGDPMTPVEVEQYINWSNAVVNIDFSIAKLRFVTVGSTVHFSPEVTINSIQVWRNGPPRDTAQHKRTFSAAQLLSSVTASRPSTETASSTAPVDDDEGMSDGELAAQTEAVEQAALTTSTSPARKEARPEKRRKIKASSKKDRKIKSAEFVDAD